MSLKHGSLFSGVGGFDLAAEWMGWENMFHCEWNQFGQKVLKYYWPNAVSYDDICKTDFTIWNGRIDILTGGFPCQPYSMAGKRQGTEDARHLWPEMCRAIRECRPTWIVGENVPGLINWSGGLVFEQVCADLEGEGYEVQPIVLPASGVNAPHRRDRVWFIAYCNNAGSGDDNNRIDGIWEATNERRNGQPQPEFGNDGKDGYTQNPNENGRGGDERKEESSIGRFGNIGAGDNERLRTDNEEAVFIANTNCKRVYGVDRVDRVDRVETGEDWKRTDEFDGNSKDVTDTSSTRREELHTTAEPTGQRHRARMGAIERTDWQNFPTQSPICNGDDGLSSRLDGITFPKWRNESIKAGGNAIVPQVALQIFKVIEQMQNT